MNQEMRSAHEEWRGHFTRCPLAFRWDDLPPQGGDAAAIAALAFLFNLA